jgi:ribonuclease Y
MYIYIIVGVVCLALGIIVSLFANYIKRTKDNKNILKSNELAKKILEDSKMEAETLKKSAVLEAKEGWYKTQKTYEDEINRRKKELYILEKEFNERVSSLDKRLMTLEKKDEYLIS